MKEIQWRLINLQGEYQQRFGKNLSNLQIAKETGLSKNTVGDIANGKVRRPDEATVRLILDCLSKHLQRPLNTNELWYYVTPPPTDEPAVDDLDIPAANLSGEPKNSL